MRRTLVTGAGIWSCIGQSLESVEESLREGRSGIGIAADRTEYGYQSPLSGIVPTPDIPVNELSLFQRKCLSEPSAFAYMAVKQALAQAGLEDGRGLALIVSCDSTVCASAVTEELMQKHHDTRRLGGYQVFRQLNSTVSMVLSSIFGFDSLSFSISAACAGGAHAVGIAHRLIQSGCVKGAVVVGAQEVGTRSYAAFDALGVFSRRVESPQTASRPFDVERDGLVPSGGSAAVVMEEADSFRTRCDSASLGAHALAEIKGYGFSTSTSMISPSVDSVHMAMLRALEEGRYPDSISTIFPHATSTREGDSAEACAITKLMTILKRPPIVAPLKSLTGHECWMAGVSSLVYAIIQAKGGFVAPHPSLTKKDPSASYLLIPKVATPYSHDLCLLNAFGFGGTNASLLVDFSQP